MSAAFALTRHVLPATAKLPALTIEPLPADLAPLLGEAFAAIDPWASYPYPASGLASYFAAEEPGAPRFAVRLGADLAGAAGLRLNWLRGPYVQFLGVLPPFQCSGVGAGVLGWIEEEARTAGERNLWVAASDFNAHAIRFYERHGFLLVARLPGLVSDEHTELLLRKRL